MLPLLVVAANDIDASGLRLDVELPVAWLKDRAAEAEGTATEPGRFEGRLSRSGRADIVVRGRVKATFELPCARCLKAVLVPIDTEIGLLLKPRAAHEPPKANAKPAAAPSTGDTQAKKAKRRKAPEPEYEFTSEEADEDTYDGEKVVLDSFVREALLLEVPSFPLCSEACTGIEEPASEGLPGLRNPASPVPVPAESRGGTTRPNPFEALRHLLDDGGAEPVRRPSAAEVRRAARARSRAKPKMRSSMASRTKK
ncbi:MAG: DUF177 domain-containing protein [Myxococcales bacterium]|nr:DUF177 domain-containing protein [Myxococcales bacterium]